MLTQKAKYAIIAIIYLARHHEGEPIRISELAHEEEIPQKFLEAILLELKKHGFLSSKKGKGGGYQLSQSPTDITMGQIIRTIDGPLAPVPCVSHTAYQKCDACKDEKTCGIRLVMKDVRDAMADVLDQVSIHEVIHRIDKINLTQI